MAGPQPPSSVRIPEECTICTDGLRNPKVLSCRHVFCELCLKLWIEKQTKADSKKSVTGIECPLCRRICEPTESTAEPSEWASMLPDATSVEEDQLLCEPCQSTSEKNQARFFCTECNEYLCTECQKTHRKLKFSRSHMTVETTAKTRARIPLYMEYSKLLKCDAHTDKYIEFFCKDHDEVFCSTCAFVFHRTCSDIMEIKRNCSKVPSGKPLAYTLKIFETLRKSVRDIIDVHEKFEAEVELKESSMDAKLKDMKQSLLKRFEKFETVVRDSLKQQNKIVKDVNADQMAKLSAVEENLESLVKTTEEILKMQLTGSNADYIIATRRLDRKYKGSLDDAVKLQQERFTCFVFKPNDSFQSILNTGQLLGTVVEKESNIKAPLLHMEKNFRDKVFIRSVAKLRMPVSRREPFYTSACYFEGREFVFLDQTNKRILMSKNVTEAGIAKPRLKSLPYDVVCTKSAVVFVSFPAEQTIRKYHAKEDFQEICEIKTDSECYALGFVESFSRIVSSCLQGEDSWELVSFDSDGRRVATLSNAAGRQFQTFFHCLIMEDTVYQSCQKDNRVYAFSLEDGKSVFVYENKGLKCPGGIGRDLENNIYICGIDSGNVHVVSVRGKLMKIVELTYLGTIFPTNICFNENGEDIVVLGNAGNPGPFVYKFSSE